jgi:hypothetical protein
VRIVARKHDNALRANRRNDRTVFQRHGTYRVHEFQVLSLGVVDQGNGGLHHGRQVGDFAGVIHAHFDHGNAVVCPQAQQRHRHTDVVVVVAARCQRRTIGMEGRQNGRQHLRDGGFPVASRHRDHGHRKLHAPGVGQRTQRQPGVFHNDADHAGQPAAVGTRVANRGNGTALLGLQKVVVGVVALALERHEQVPSLDRAGVRVNANDGHRPIAVQLRPGQPLDHLCGGHHAGVHKPTSED